MSTRSQAITRVANKIHDIGGGVDQNEDVMLSDTEIGEEVDAAVVAFSLDRPRERVIDITAITSPYIDTSTLTGYVPGWSTILSIEWQAEAVDADYLPSYLNLDTGIEEYRDTTKHYIYLKGLTPVVGDITRFRYTTPHATLTATSSDDTIPAVYFDAMCNLAASYCCTRLAAHFSAASDPTIAADAVSYRDSQLRMRQTAEDFRKMYQQQVGVTEPGSRPASAVRDWNSGLSVGGTWLTHTPGWRSWRRVS
jgi:hypothetical protein